MGRSKIITNTVVVAIGEAAGTRQVNQELDTDFDFCTGFFAVRNKGADYLRVAIKDQEGNVYVATTNLKTITVGEEVKIKDRFYANEPFRAKGKKMVIEYTWFSAPIAEQSFDIVFELRSEK